MSKIIKEDDPRYEHLGDLFRKWNWNNFRIKSTTKYQYVIPKELSLLDDDYFIGNSKTWIKSDCKLSLQEYFDLLVLHINDTEDRPRCKYCGNHLMFREELARGYSSHEWGTSVNLFCSTTCRQTYIHSHKEEYPHEILRREIWSQQVAGDYIRQAKAALNRMLNRGEWSDIIIFYTGTYYNAEWLKYGITEDFDSRNRKGDLYDFTLLEITRDRACLLEYLIKVRVKDLTEIDGEYIPIKQKELFKSVVTDISTTVTRMSESEVHEFLYRIKD